jgi:hypothetical protein
MAREPNRGLGDGTLIVQEGKEALQDTEACCHRTGGERVTEGGLDPGIHIRGSRLRQVVRERGLAGLRQEAHETLEGTDGAFLHRVAIVTRT